MEQLQTRRHTGLELFRMVALGVATGMVIALGIAIDTLCVYLMW